MWCQGLYYGPESPPNENIMRTLLPKSGIILVRSGIKRIVYSHLFHGGLS